MVFLSSLDFHPSPDYANKNKTERRGQGIRKNLLFWNGQSLRANPKKSCGGVSRKKTCYYFLGGFIPGWRDAQCVIQRENASGDELCYTQPQSCAREWINSELQSVRKAHNIYVVSSLCPWKCSSQDCGLRGCPDFREDLWMQPSWARAAPTAQNPSSLMN